jgi:hypothetical protein
MPGDGRATDELTAADLVAAQLVDQVVLAILLLARIASTRSGNRCMAYPPVPVGARRTFGTPLVIEGRAEPGHGRPS